MPPLLFQENEMTNAPGFLLECEPDFKETVMKK